MKILSISDHGTPSGYGRIADEVMTRLQRRGHQVWAASFLYDGLIPPQNNGVPLPYHVSSLRHSPDWAQDVVKLIAAVVPDVIVVTQDASYALHLWQARVDWTRHAVIVITPVDGVPINPSWITMAKNMDGFMSISEFGVNAYREQGIEAQLCRPNADPDVFFPYAPERRAEVRATIGASPDDYIWGSVCMNQGRKQIPTMLEAFYRFARDKPHARYILNMDPVSQAGWHIPNLCTQHNWDSSRLLFRDSLERLGLSMTDRYNLMDVHIVLSSREGYGLPLIESQACGVATVAQDYCSGPEICGDGNGVLIPTIGYDNYGTWGGAADRYPDKAAVVEAMQRLYDHPDQRQTIAQAGMKRTRQWHWGETADAVERVLHNAVDNHRQGIAT